MTITSVTPPRQKTVSFPLGLFCDATISVPHDDLGASSIPADIDEIFPGPIRKDLTTGEPEEDINWNDTSS
jgi:hypothetical protein